MVAVHKLLLCTGLQPDFVLQDKITTQMGYDYHIIGMDSDRNVYTAVQYCSLLTEFSERYYMNYACTTCSSN